jgi:peptide/nickel transport system substrate-binding protein
MSSKGHGASRRAVQLALTTVLLGLTACGGSADGENGAGREAIRIGFGNPPSTWSPGTGTDMAYVAAPYETLVAPDYSTDDDLTDLVPRLATEWTQTDRDVTFTLREGVEFHDGEPFNAEAVKANIEFAVVNPDRYSSLVEPIASIDVVDEYVVRFNLSTASPTLLTDLTGQAGIMASPRALADGTTASQPVGTGPWRWNEEASVEGQRWQLDLWDGYWDDLPDGTPEALQYVHTPDVQARMSAVLAGELDVADLNPPEAARAEEAAKTVLPYPAIGAGLVMFDRGPGGLFEDIETRRAVCQAIDAEAAVQASDGYLSVIPQRFAGTPYENPEIELPEYDSEAASDYFASHPISATIPAISGASTVPEALAGMLTQAGADVSVQTMPESDYHPVWNTGEFPIGFGGESEVHPLTWYQGFFAADGPYNPSGVETEEIAQAAAAAVEAGTSPEATELWQTAIRLMTEQWVICPQWNINQFLVSDPERVTGVAPADFLPTSLDVRALRTVD